MQIFTGDEKTLNTWASNAPYYSRVIAAIFTWVNFFELNDYRLEILLSINILLSAVATYSLYRIGRHITGHAIAGLLCAGLYAFSYPTLYFNVFLLGEPFAVPIIIFSLWLLLEFKDSYRCIALAGLVLAFGVGVRPSNGLIGLPAALYIVFAGTSLRGKNWRQWFTLLFPRAVRAGIFSIAFFIVILGITAENYRVSDGRLAGITAHSGYNFFLGQTQAHKIISTFDGMIYIFVPSSVTMHPEFGTVSVSVPIYDSATFFEMGWQILRDNPQLWWDHVLEYEDLFFNNLLPAVPSVWGFRTLFDPFRYITFTMLLLCGLIYVPWREKDISTAHIMLFSAIFFLLSASLYFFTLTHQYFQNFSYTVYIVFTVALWGCIRHYRKYRRLILTYVGCVIAATVLVQGYKVVARNVYPEKIRVLIEQSRVDIANFEQPKDIERSESLTVNNLEFFQSEGFLHGTLGDLGYKDNFYVTADTEFEVLEDSLYQFTFYMDDGYNVFIDGEYLLGYDGLKQMDEYQLTATRFLTAGRHTFHLEYFEARVFSGLMAYYKPIENALFALSQHEPKGGRGTLIGDDDAVTKFYLPEN